MTFLSKCTKSMLPYRRQIQTSIGCYRETIIGKNERKGKSKDPRHHKNTWAWFIDW